MISRRKLFGWLAAGALIAPELLSAHRKIFLPPRGGWPHGRLAALIIPPDHAWMWEAEIAAGQCEYDSANELMTLLKCSDRGTTEPREWASIPLVVPLDEFGNKGLYLAPKGGGIRKPNESLKREYERSRGIPLPPQVFPTSVAVADPAARARADARADEISKKLGWI